MERSRPRPSLGDVPIAAILFVVISSIYFATITGVTSSNDGSHYALVRALVERHSFEISPYLDFTEHQDYALNGDRRFSDRPPGTALMAAPLYALGRLGPVPLVVPPSKHDAGNPGFIFAVTLSSLAGAGTIILFYLALRRLWAITQAAAMLSSIALSLATTLWKYSAVLFSHAAASVVIALTLYLVLRDEVRTSTRTRYFAIGFLIGFAPLVEYTNALFSLIVALYFLWGIWPQRRERWVWAQKMIPMIAGGLIPLTFILFYNTVNFGGPLEISTFNVDIERWPQNEGFAADFATPLQEGLAALLVWGPQPDEGFYNQGLFLLMPVTLLALPGLWYFWHSAPRRHTGLITGLFVVYLLLFAKSTTYNAATNDGRYLTPFLSLLFIPVGFTIEELWTRPRPRSITSMLLVGLVFGLILLSIRNQFMHIAFAWNYDLKPDQLLPFAAHPLNIIRVWGTVFRNAANLPILLAGEGLVVLLWVLVRRWRFAQNSLPDLSDE